MVFRIDWTVFDMSITVICSCFSTIGLLVFAAKKFMLKRNLQVVPQSMIFAISNTNQAMSQREVEECENGIEMETFHNNSRIINVQPFPQSDISNETGYQHENESGSQIENEIEIIADPLPIIPLSFANSQLFEQNNPPQPQINNCKYNKNLINFVSFLMVFTIINVVLILFYARYNNWLSFESAGFFQYVCMCFVSIGLPTIYFVRHPTHFINVLKELQILSW